MDINIKDIDKKDSDRLSEIAKELGMRSRSEYLQKIVRGLVDSKAVTFILPESLIKEIKLRIDDSYPEPIGIEATVKQDLTRYYNLIRRERYEFIPFTYNEAVFLANAFNGTMTDFTIDPYALLNLSVQDQFDCYANNVQIEKSKADVFGFTEEERLAFLDKIKDFSRLQSAFVLDALDQFWHTSKYYRDGKETSDELIAAGLTTQKHRDQYFSDKEVIG